MGEKPVTKRGYVYGMRAWRPEKAHTAWVFGFVIYLSDWMLTFVFRAEEKKAGIGEWR